MYGGSPFQPFAFQSFADAFGAGRQPARGLPDAGLKNLGAATRTAWSIGIEWYDYARKAQDIAVSAAGRIAAARSPAEVFTVQTAYLREAGELAAARMPVFFELTRTLMNDMAGMPSGRRG